LVNGRRRLLSHLDNDVSDALRQSMTARLNIAVHGDADVTRVEVENRRAYVTLSDGMTLNADVVLVCTGRIGNAGSLGLEALGVRTNDRGFVQVDAQYRTSVPHILAAGDVIGFPALASTSMEQARVAMCHAFDLKYKERVSAILPMAVYTIPEIGAVGETEQSCREKKIPCCVGRAYYQGNSRGQIIGDFSGLIKLVFRADDKRLLGVHILGEMASELVHIGQGCLHFSGTIDYFIQSVFNYPTLAEAYKYAAYDGLGNLARGEVLT
jgi:NAD(P) transhydrogenase